jgi:membrane fusion protein, multidrug efflux system
MADANAEEKKPEGRDGAHDEEPGLAPGGGSVHATSSEQKDIGEGGAAAGRPDTEHGQGEDQKKEGAKQDEQGEKKGDQEKDKGEGKSGHSKVLIWVLAAVFVGAGLFVLTYHLLVGRYHVTTKDAYVNGDLIRLSPQISGTVTEIAADESQYVPRGGLLVLLDSHDADVSLAQAKANLGQTLRDVTQLFESVRQAEAQVDAQRAQLILGLQTLHRDRALLGIHGVSQQDVERDEQAVRSARAGIRQAEANLAATRAAVTGTRPETHPRVLLAEANLRSAWLTKARTRVLAPVSGFVMRRIVQLGQQVTPATDMLAMAPLESVWVDANFKETELAKLRINQPVEVTADIYGSHHRYHGRLLGLTGGTGSALAVLPAENATGNWIKIVQRLPVRIGLDAREVENFPLFLGLSMDINVDVHDLRGPSLTKTPAWPAALRTSVYADQDAGVDAEIRRIVGENLPSPSEALRTAQASP